MKKLLLIFLSCLFTSSFAYALCFNHSISSKSDGGRIITLDDDTKWEVLYGDEVNSNAWAPEDDVLLCDDIQIIHPQDGDKIWVRYVNR